MDWNETFGAAISDVEKGDICLLPWAETIVLTSEGEAVLGELVKQSGHHQSPFSPSQGRHCHL